MTAQLISGKDVAEKIRAELQPRIAALKAKGINTGLAAIAVGEDAGAQSYLKGIAKACEALGIYTETFNFPIDVTQQKLEQQVEALNKDTRFQGVIIQRPLPKHINENTVLRLLATEKDVDCLNPLSMAKLMMRETDGFAPCTPSAVIELLDRYNVPIEGKRVVIIGGAGNIGRTAGIMLLNRWATVVLCDYKTQNPAEEFRRAEILVSAVGKPKMIKKDVVSPGAVVIDVGVSRGADGKLSGDMDFDEVSQVAGMITPVPGGVGAVTTTILLAHTVQAAERLSK
ncbi:MAG: tetrahydrofolate dehydrogenase/cyclohydrolase catalytic domain-containing protein [Dehalococcoidales bacterium]|nr:tetrahydrofolate dehydrogenase/cyclohydrolase catalytic domain-containing protein [Dehalococcoidales bacterium]